MADTYKILSENVKINNLESVVTTYNFALGKAEGEAKIIAFNETNIGGTRLEEAKDGDIKIYSLDELNINEKIDFMKIDVEGFENNVLAGGINTIEKHRPIIFIEIQKENYDKVQKFFKEKEYRLIKEYEADNFLFAYKEDRFGK